MNSDGSLPEITSICRGSRRCTRRPSGNPRPAGWKTSVWSFGWCQAPRTRGTRSGSAREDVGRPGARTSGRSAPRERARIGAGRTSTCGSGPGGNQLTLSGAGQPLPRARGAGDERGAGDVGAASATPIGTTRRGRGQRHPGAAPSRHLHRDDLHGPAEPHRDRGARGGINTSCSTSSRPASGVGLDRLVRRGASRATSSAGRSPGRTLARRELDLGTTVPVRRRRHPPPEEAARLHRLDVLAEPRDRDRRAPFPPGTIRACGPRRRTRRARRRPGRRTAPSASTVTKSRSGDRAAASRGWDVLRKYRMRLMSSR